MSPEDRLGVCENHTATGYARQNGGTTGGAGDAITTVPSYAAFASAVSGDAKKVVLVSGTISPAADQF